MLLNEITGCTASPGHIGIQGKGAEIEIAKMFAEPLKN